LYWLNRLQALLGKLIYIMCISQAVNMISAWCALAMLVGAVVSGCGTYRYAEGSLHYTLPIERVEVVEEDFERPPLVGGIKPPTDILPAGFQVKGLAEGADFYAVSGSSYAEYRLWLFDKQWRMYGEIKLPVPPGERCDGISFRWNASGHQLAVNFSTWHVARPYEKYHERIGIVCPPELSLQCISEPVPQQTGVTGIAWSPENRLFGIAMGETEDTLLEVATDTCQLTRTWTQAHDPAVIMGPPLISPSGTWLTCERFAIKRPYVASRIGILLINLYTGEGVEATSEHGSAYNHQLYQWENDNIMLFTRSMGNGKARLYRAYLRSNGDLAQISHP